MLRRSYSGDGSRAFIPRKGTSVQRSDVSRGELGALQDPTFIIWLRRENGGWKELEMILEK